MLSAMTPVSIPAPNAWLLSKRHLPLSTSTVGGRNTYHGAVEDRGILGNGWPVAIADIAGPAPRGGGVDERIGRGGPDSWVATVTILILGGTAEARQLAAALVTDGVEVISCLPDGSTLQLAARTDPDWRLRRRRWALRLPAPAAGFGAGGRHPSIRNDNQPERAAGGVSNTAGAAGTSGCEHPRSGSWTWVVDAAAARSPPRVP